MLSLKEKKKTVFIFVRIMGKIYLKNIRLYSYHGCMDEEEKIGGDYVVNLKVKTDLSTSSKSDILADTVDYVSLHSIVKQEMAQRSKLLETVADRIINRVIKEHQAVVKVSVKVAKKNPPIGGNVEEVAVKRELKRTSLDLN